MLFLNFNFSSEFRFVNLKFDFDQNDDNYQNSDFIKVFYFDLTKNTNFTRTDKILDNLAWYQYE